MENRIWKIVSYLLHPIFMPAVGAFIVMRSGMMLFLPLSSSVFWLIILGTIFSCTVLFPLLLCLALLKYGRISSLIQPTEVDRRILMIISELGFLVAFLAFHSILGICSSLSLFLLGINMVMVVTLCLNFIKRTSFHATGAGGLLGTVIGIAWYANVNMNYSILGVLILGWLAGYARYKLKAHNEGEIYSGYLAGLLCMAMVFFIGAKIC